MLLTWVVNFANPYRNEPNLSLEKNLEANITHRLTKDQLKASNKLG